MNICVNPSCCNIDTFGDDVCPMCNDVMSVDTATYLAAIADSERATALANLLDSGIFDDAWNDYKLTT